MKYWLIVGSSVMLYSTVITYLMYTTKMMQVKYCVTESKAGRYYSIPFFVAAIMSPFFGLLIDKIGKIIFFL